MTDADTERMLDHRMLDRMLFFSDAVFAIVLTLLVLELRPPMGESDAELAEGVAAMARSFVAYAISFALGGAFWMAHMRNLRMLRVFDWPTTALNLLHLLMVGLIPFAAAILGEHISSTTAFLVYTCVIMLVSFSSALVWSVASRGKGRLLYGGITLRRRLASLLRVSGIGICFAIGLTLTLNGQLELGRFCWALIFPIMFVARILGGKEPKLAREGLASAA